MQVKFLHLTDQRYTLSSSKNENQNISERFLALSPTKKIHKQPNIIPKATRERTNKTQLVEEKMLMC